jgi:hypothetical protein
MRAVDVGRHDPDRNRLLNSQCPVARLEPGDDIARFTHDADAITRIGLGHQRRRKRHAREEQNTPHCLTPAVVEKPEET